MRIMYFFSSLCFLMIVSCNIFRVSDNSGKLSGSQRTPLGVVTLFKDALDSNDQHIAKALMRRNDGKPLLALERFDLAEDLQRYRRLVLHKPITSTKIDSLAPTQCRVVADFDYIKKLQFYTVKVEELWYVYRVSE